MKLSKKHKSFIQENMKKLSIEEISEKINIGQQIVRRYIKILQREKVTNE